MPVRARGADRRREHHVRIKPYKGGTLAVLDDGDLMDIVGRWVPGQRLLSVDVDGRRRIVQVRRAGRGWSCRRAGAATRCRCCRHTSPSCRST